MDLRRVQAILAIMPDADLDVNNGDEIIWRDSRTIPSDADIDAMIKTLEDADILELKLKSIGDHIYSYYSRDKQTQDGTYTSSYVTRLKAYGVENLELEVITMVRAIMDGATIEEELEDVPEEYQYMYIKLIKIAFRTAWAEECVIEGKLAIAEDRAPIYPEFPVFP